MVLLYGFFQKNKELFNRMSNCGAVYKAVDNGSDFIIVDFSKAAEEFLRITLPIIRILAMFSRVMLIKQCFINVL